MALLHSPSIVTDGLVLCLDAANRQSYPGSGTVWNDLSNRGNNGTLINGVGYSGTNGGNLVFDGANDYVSINDNIGNFGLFNYTISIGFRTTDTRAPATLIAKSIGGNPTANYGWLVNQSTINGELGFAVATAAGSWGVSGSYSIRTSGGAINDGRWKFVSIVADRALSDVSIYINGLPVDLQAYVGKSSLTTLGDISNNEVLTIGSESDIVVSPLRISSNTSQVTIYNRALTPAEVLQNYNATKGRFNL